MQPSFHSPNLQYISTSISSDDARLDIVAENFWGHNRQKTYFDVRVFNRFCATLSKVPLPQCYRRAELEKKRAYEQRIREIEFGSFSPLVFSTTGGLGSISFQLSDLLR